MKVRKITLADAVQQVINNIVYLATLRGERMREGSSDSNSKEITHEETLLYIELPFILNCMPSLSAEDKTSCMNDLKLMRDITLAAGYFNQNPLCREQITMAADQVAVLERDIKCRLGIEQSEEEQFNENTTPTSYTLH